MENHVPSYHEGLYDNDLEIANVNSVEHFRTFLNLPDVWIQQVDQMNEYAEIYCTFPTEENKLNVKAHLVAFGRACAHWSSEGFERKIQRHLKDFAKTLRKVDPTSEEEISLLFHQIEENKSKYHQLTTIASDCVKLVRSLYYVEQKDNPPYPPAPPPIEGFPLSPVEGYRTDISPQEIMDMFLAFTEKALDAPGVFQFALENRDSITFAFENIRTMTDNIFYFNIDPGYLKENCSRSIPNRTEEIMYLIHSFQIFIVYGNFIVDETTNFVKGINLDELVNRSEMASTVYLYGHWHGKLEIQKTTEEEDVSELEELNVSELVEEATEVVPPGMRLFMLKQAEPLCLTYLSPCLKSYEPGTLSHHSGICNLTCKQKDPLLCNCRDVLDYTTIISAVSTAVNGELRKDKVPTIAYLQQTLNASKEKALQGAIQHPKEERWDPSAMIYKPGNYLVPNNLQTHSRLKRNREFIGRIPLITTSYINKAFEADPVQELYGIYDLLTGRLISATDNFFRHFQTSAADPWGMITKIRKDESDDPKPLDGSPHYLNQCKLKDIIHYFNKLGYRNVYLFDHSCEVVGLDSGLTRVEQIQVSDKIGNAGLGVFKKKSRRLRRDKKRKTRKHSKRSRRTLRSRRKSVLTKRRK